MDFPLQRKSELQNKVLRIQVQLSFNFAPSSVNLSKQIPLLPSENFKQLNIADIRTFIPKLLR